jgi:hypothetical protein
MTKRKRRTTEWLCSSAIAFVLSAIAFVLVTDVPGVVSDVEARPRRKICEQWRDYYYNVETGAFIEWAGDPYWFCYDEDDPRSRPRSPRPDYDGGFGTPRDPREEKCKKCVTTHDACTRRVSRGGDRCISHYSEQARSWCMRHRRKKRGLPLEGCELIEGPRGKPVYECKKSAIDDCVESFARDEPGVSSKDTLKVNIGFDWWGVGADRASTVTWGESRGYVEGCRLAEQEASGICLSNLHTCKEKAGGCQ